MVKPDKSYKIKRLKLLYKTDIVATILLLLTDNKILIKILIRATYIDLITTSLPLISILLTSIIGHIIVFFSSITIYSLIIKAQVKKNFEKNIGFFVPK